MTSTENKQRLLTEKVPTKNREGLDTYDIVWPWERGEQAPGIGGVLRVKNEAKNLPFVLPGLFEAGLSELHLIDNGSTDDTVAVAERVAGEANAREKLHLHTYPHSVSRCGREHLDTPPDSLASLPYFYNWAFSRPSTTYGLKWDGDMVLTPKGIRQMRRLVERFPGKNVVLRIPRHPVYVKSEKEAWIDLGSRNTEAFGWPVSPDFAHFKAFDWEVPLWPENVRYHLLGIGSCLELKWLDEDEFSHWTPDSFSFVRSKRKIREHYVHSHLSRGQAPRVEGLKHVVSPDSRHVIEYLKTDWLREAPKPLIAAAIREESDLGD